MKKIGICTRFTGYNYGSALQAFAVKRVLSRLGYCAEIWKISGSLVYGRDIRVRKMLHMGFRLLLHLQSAPVVLHSFFQKKKGQLPDRSRELFRDFIHKQIQPCSFTEAKMKRLAREKTYAAFVCGSDQIWNSTTYYVDPFYYLSFAPKDKRIAYAPSLGRGYIPEYNRRILRKYLSQIPFLSVRETVGRKLIYELTGREAEVLMDPTLLLTGRDWIHLLELTEQRTDNYVLAYFLDTPSEKAKQMLSHFRKAGYRILQLPCDRQGDWYDCCLEAGPREFVQYLLNADIICTDSFHGTAFSINFEKDFYSFRREYGVNADQSSRLTSLLELVGFLERYDAEMPSDQAPDYGRCRRILEAERKKAEKYLTSALETICRSSEDG